MNPAYETAIILGPCVEGERTTGESGEPHYRFFVCDGTDKFSAFANSILPVQLIETRLVPIDEY